MTVVTFLLLAILSISTEINGRIRTRTSCLQSNLFRCDDGYCIHKHNWCDGRYHCGDNSDEKYCNLYDVSDCNDNIHFRCKSDTMCIPREGYCDGYSSCPDRSDEEDCPCEELHGEEGSIEYEAFIDQYRTQQKCWKIAVSGRQYVDIKISTDFYVRPCEYGNITIIPEGDYFIPRFLCPLLHHPTSRNEQISTFNENVLIRYRSNYYDSNNNHIKDLFNITYKRADLLCLAIPKEFKCTNNTCILLEKQCDGIEDCPNGRDEQSCEYGAFSSAFLESNRKKTIEWMQNQHDADWGWKENTHKAVVALNLAGGMNLNGSNREDDLIAKQLELEVSTFLFRSKIEERSIADLSAYINALLVICHDPRNFYGFDLVTALKDELQTVAEYTPPFPYLTLCNAKEPVSADAVNHLLQILQDSPDHGFVLEIQALAIMAISCAINNNNQYAHLKQNVSEALNNLKKEQMQDGSFGNEYTTAIVLQALIANSQVKAKDWNPKSAIKFLMQKQEVHGSFDDFLTTYLVLPVLNMKSLLDVGKINCTEDFKRPRDGGMISDIKNRLGGKIVVKYTLFIGDEKDQIHPIVLRTHENITVFELMTLAADIDPKYKFKTHQIKKKMYIYEISNIPNDSESNKFWFMYEGVENGTIPISEQSPDKVKVHKKDHIIMWYKTLNFI